MVWWLLKKRGNNEVSHEAIKGSFSNIKKDMNHLGKWINHFKDKHDSHDKNHKDLLERLDKIEALLASQQTQEEIQKESFYEEDSSEMLPEIGHHKELSLAEYDVCEKLAVLNRDNNDWISLRQLAAEVYPEKEYSKSRSAMAQLIKKLEEKDYVTKKVIKKCAYVHLKKDQDIFLENIKKSTLRKKKKEK
tara:strand:+ start:716 stop:1288 length:573 start_codon:yes stop_codon:yes gene_type:complete